MPWNTPLPKTQADSLLSMLNAWTVPHASQGREIMTIIITSSVGRNGVNNPIDVETIGAALVAIGPERGGIFAIPLTLDALGEAIEAFQKFHQILQKPDGRVDPMGKTHSKINAILNGDESSSDVTVTISGFTQYKTRILDLDLDAQLDFERIAHAIVNSFLLDGRHRPVTHVLAVGHADSDAQGAAFEQIVSENRASNAVTYLKERVHAIADVKDLNPLNLNAIIWEHRGVGAQRKVFPFPANEEERAANRRFDLVVQHGSVSPPITHTWQQGVLRAIAALNGRPESGPVRRSKCMLIKLRDDPATIDGWMNRRALWQIPGSAGMPKLSPAQWDMAITAIVSHVRAELAREDSYGPQVSDDQVFNNLLSLDDRIGESIDFTRLQSVADSATGRFHRVLIAFVHSQMLNPKSIYSCYADYSRQHHED